MVIYDRAPLFSLTELVLIGTFVAHDVGWIITGFFTIVATVVSFWLINKHLQWYTVVRFAFLRRFPPSSSSSPYGQTAILISLYIVFFSRRNESNAVGFYLHLYLVYAPVSPADSLFRRHHSPAPYGPHILMDQPRIVPLLGPHLLFLAPDPFGRALTPVMKFPRITLHPYFSSATHTRPSYSPLFSIFCSRICPRIPKCRKPYFANVVCQRKPTRNADGVGSPQGSGSSLSDL